MRPTLLLTALFTAVAIAVPTNDANNNDANPAGIAINQDECGDCEAEFNRCMRGCSWFIRNCDQVCRCKLDKHVSTLPFCVCQ
jgi:hypothetical protein